MAVLALKAPHTATPNQPVDGQIRGKTSFLENFCYNYRKENLFFRRVKMCESCGCGEENSFEQEVKQIIDSIRPMLQNDGGDVELLGVDSDNTVRVRLQGACRGCPGAQMTLKMGIERLLKERIPEVKQVVAVD